MEGVIVAARIALVAVFAVAGAAKLADLAGSRQALRGFGVPDALATPLGTLLPLAELIVAGALLTASAAWWGTLGALGLLLMFIGAISYNLAQGRTPDCHCFGQIHSAPAGWPTLLRNGLLAVIAGFVVWQGPNRSGPGLVSWLSAMTPMYAFGLGAGLLLLGTLIGLGWLLLNLLQQNGRLLLRVEALEARLGINEASSVAAKPEAGLVVGMPAPAFQLASLTGETISLATLRARNKPIMLMFSDLGCGPCTALLPDLARWQNEHHDALTIALVSRGTHAANQAKIDGLGLTDVLLQQDREVSKAYEIKATPTAVLVRADGSIGSPLALGAGAIAALVDSVVSAADPDAEIAEDHNESDYPDPLPLGAPVPQFTLPDLNGKQIGLADFRGRPTLLIFWDPDCGFCQRMLADLQTWTARPPRGAPQVLIISTGSIAANQAMGLRAPVVLDEEFSVGRLFGATGTPMAVLIDAEGRIGSPVRAGAPAVFALAQSPNQMKLLPA